MQLIWLLTRLDDATDEIVLRFSNMHDLLPSNYVPFFFEDSADVVQLQQMMYRMRQYHLHPSLEIGHLERNPTSAIEKRIEADGSSTEFYTPELPPRFNAPVATDEFARVKAANPTAFQGYVAPSTTPLAPPPPPASLPAAPSQPHAPPEVYLVHPSASVPSNASPRRPDQAPITSWFGPTLPQAPFLRSGQPNPTMGLSSGSSFYGARSPQAPSGSQPMGRSSTLARLCHRPPSCAAASPIPRWDYLPGRASMAPVHRRLHLARSRWVGHLHLLLTISAYTPPPRRLQLLDLIQSAEMDHPRDRRAALGSDFFFFFVLHDLRAKHGLIATAIARLS
jgi:hypothetical protein